VFLLLVINSVTYSTPKDNECVISSACGRMPGRCCRSPAPSTFQPICKQPHLNIDDSHVVILADLDRAGTHRKISEQVVNVTQQFVGPGYTGGISLLLLQPSNYHPHREGQDTVILYCRTLTVLDEGLRAVTCGSMGSGSPAVSLIDSAHISAQMMASQTSIIRHASIGYSCHS
jgi:hypothetical protein